MSEPLRVGIVGCGQLSRMLALAGLPLGLKFSFVNDTGQTDTACIDGLGTIVSWQPGDSIAELYNALGKPDVVTVEKEQVNLHLLESLEKLCRVSPSSKAVAACQHRYNEKNLLKRLAIPTAEFLYNTAAATAATSLQYPFVIKSCSDGYDGNNQWRIKNRADADFFDSNNNSNDYIAEKWINFDQEVSLISTRSASGDIQHYALTQNIHENGILKQSVAPAPSIRNDIDITALAQDYIERILVDLNYVGVLAMECFVKEGELLINELAPRVHNSGHWTQASSITCQFENHLRAITNLPLGSTLHHGVTGMINLIGVKKPPLELLSPNSTLHWYNKSSRAGRKLGHINITEKSYAQLTQEIANLQQH